MSGRVTGLGGVFIKSIDPKALMQWYARHLGVKLSDWGGITFDWKDEVPAGTGTTAFSAFPDGTDYFGRGPQTFMLNFRVDDLEILLIKLSEQGVEIDSKREDTDYGRFAWIVDPEGNRVELWEPVKE